MYVHITLLNISLYDIIQDQAQHVFTHSDEYSAVKTTICLPLSHNSSVVGNTMVKRQSGSLCMCVFMSEGEIVRERQRKRDPHPRRECRI